MGELVCSAYLERLCRNVELLTFPFERVMLGRIDLNGGMEPVQSASPCEQSPEDSASCFSWILFRWLTPYVVTGYKRRLEHKDRIPLSCREHISKTYTRFSRHWDDPVLSADSSRPLARAIWRTFAVQLRCAFIGRIVAVALELAGPVLLHEVVLFLSSSSWFLG